MSTNLLEFNKKFFKEAGFGMMIHWGLYSLLAGEYKGKRTSNSYWSDLGEWIMYNFNIPIKEYEKLAESFNPLYFNAEEWVSLAKEAGMKYIVFTSKHHDGFAMYESKVSDYNIKNKTPFKRDIIKELSEACKKYDIKFGLYYSQEFDWHEKDGGGYNYQPNLNLSNYWDFDYHKANYDLYFKNKVLSQVDEITKNYGDLFVVWFDTPVCITKSQSEELYNLVRKNQPGALINTRIGNGLGDFESANDNDLTIKSDKGLAEVPATLNKTWGYVYYDNNWKTADNIYNNLINLNRRGINYLLNVGPDSLGRIPSPSIDILKEVGSLIKNNKNNITK